MANGTCSVCGVEVKTPRRGMCKAHYRRWKRYGDPLAGRPVARAASTSEEKRERMRAKGRRFAQAHPESERMRNRRYRRENWETARASQYRWRVENSGKWHAILYAARMRRQQRIALDAEHVDREAILTEFGMICHLCGGEIESRDDLHFDHVIPVSRGGREAYDNIRPSHAWCNMQKGSKLLSEYFAMLAEQAA